MRIWNRQIDNQEMAATASLVTTIMMTATLHTARLIIQKLKIMCFVRLALPVMDHFPNINKRACSHIHVSLHLKLIYISCIMYRKDVALRHIDDVLYTKCVYYFITLTHLKLWNLYCIIIPRHTATCVQSKCHYIMDTFRFDKHVTVKIL